ncbi:SCO2525 family SAM-dependent methyltransferase [Nucisporomicrobium flavum]|uniref:SCO2525 family SAM-dependent methyltransferase n=1 Tax=Nucisporomicrobium flavum TaxID=2785915 RepID=UPI0018F313BB|nr:SCO2525 family SAM-dependent methyltransferase [Nucisporomicrobium flavum]
MTQPAARPPAAITPVIYDGATVQDVANADCDWDHFDSASYFEHNYSTAREADIRIARIIARHFAETARLYPTGGRAIDVGAGANLYPALAMLPFAEDVHLSERAESNRLWLDAQIEQPAPSWTDFWRVISSGREPYQRVANFQQSLRRRAHVQAGDVFKLPTGVYNLGTMFFVAESITTMNKEFRRAINAFVGSLKVKAPFAAAFMKDSSGYRVGGRDYPACPVDESDIRRSFAEIAHDVKLDTIEDTEVRSGYAGMIVVTGRAGKKK